MTKPTDDTAVKIAVLTANIDAFREESKAGIESLRLLLDGRFNHIEDRFDQHRDLVDQRVDHIERETNSHEQRIAALEARGARMTGAFAVLGVVLTVLGGAIEFLFANGKDLFHRLFG